MKQLIIILIFPAILYAANTKTTDLSELTAVADADILYIVDGGTTSKKITVLNLFDTIDTFAELNTIVTIKTLVNEEDAAAWDALATFNLGLTITTGDPLTLGVVRWDDGSDQIDGEQIGDDTIDNDSIDWGDMTDLTTDGALDADVVDEAHIADNGIDSEHYNDGSIDLVHIAAAAYAKDLVTTSPITGAADNILVGAESDLTLALDFTTAWDFGSAAGSEWVNDGAPTTDAAGELALDTTITDHQPLWQYYDGGENMTIIAVDTAQLPATDNEIIKYDAAADKFVFEADGGSTAWDDIGNPDNAGLTTITFDNAELSLLTGNNDAAASFFTIQNSDADHTVGALYLLDLDYSADDGDAEADFIKCQDSGGVVFTIQQNGDTVSTGTLQGTTITATTGFSGDGSSLTAVDAATGDSATDFFDAGTIEHERGGLQADVSAYTGLIGITGADTTVEVDLLSELLTAMSDVTAFITDDDMPAAATDPDVDAAGEIGRDTDGAGETGDSSLRGFDGAAQFLYCKQIKHLSFTVQDPENIGTWTGRTNPSTVIWYNTTGMTFTITEVYAISDTDNYDFTLFESNSGTDMSDDNDASIVVVECEANGTECFTDTEAAIGHAVEKDHAIIFEDTDGAANAVSITISGWFNSDVN